MVRNGRYNPRNNKGTSEAGIAWVGGRTKKDKVISEADKALLKAVLERLHDSLEFDKELSEGKGHLSPDAKFTDGGRFALSLTRTQFEQLSDIIYNKL